MNRKPELGKYQLWLLFNKHQGIRKYLPPTARYNASTLKQFLARYGTVYVKPSGGSMGRGIMKVWSHGGTYFAKHTTRRPQSFSSFSSLVRYIDGQRQGKNYIVQKGLQLAKVKGRPFDIRVMMQREAPGGVWKFSGMIAKIAGKGSVVTNVALSRGTVMEVEEALKQGLQAPGKAAQIVSQLRELGFAAAKHFDSYQKYRELGFDVAVEPSGQIWLIEQNTGPSHALFARLRSNLSMYRTIQARWGKYQRNLKRRA